MIRPAIGITIGYEDRRCGLHTLRQDYVRSVEQAGGLPLVLRTLPLLAICRGHQVLNVATGGTLIQDIPSERVGGGDHDPRRERWEQAREVRIFPGTRLREILGAERVAVNSFHHQAVERPGRGLVISARSAKDEIIEGIEALDRRFAIGVQWHPEAFWDRPHGFHSLFAGLVEAARR